MNKGWWIAKMVVMGVAFIALMGLATQLLWNWLIPSLFNGPFITFWQALGLLALSKLLVWGAGGRCRCGNSSHMHSGRQYWKQKWTQMTPEEKEKFRAKMKDKWCGFSREEASGSDSRTSND